MSEFVRKARSSATDKEVLSKLYMVWKSARARCNRKKHKFFHRYGGRGISFCKGWDDYAAFRSWAIENGYSKGMSLDRIDVDGNYEPVNCQWIPLSENSGKDGRGIDNHEAKLTDAQVLEIRRLSASQYVIAAEYGVTQSLVSKIKARHIWRHI